MEKCLNLRKSYLPRHLRLGTDSYQPDFVALHDEVVDMPVVDDDGNAVYTVKKLVTVSAADYMSRYKASAFKLSAKVAAGVPLNVVNVNCSNVATIDELEQICLRLDSADKFVERVEREKAERQSWFTDIVEDKSLDNDLM